MIAIEFLGVRKLTKEATLPGFRHGVRSWFDALLGKGSTTDHQSITVLFTEVENATHNRMLRVSSLWRYNCFVRDAVVREKPD